MITTTIEAVLFAAAKPIKLIDLRKHLNLSQEVVREAIDDITARFNKETSGIHLMEHNETVQMVTNPLTGEDVSKFLKKEASGPLTKPSLETLTIIAYRGPITKPEIERIRGINCTLILRNLLMRGLVMEKEDKDRLQLVYTISLDFLRHLGVHSVEELPEYVSLHTHHDIDVLLAKDMPEV